MKTSNVIFMVAVGGYFAYSALSDLSGPKNTSPSYSNSNQVVQRSQSRSSVAYGLRATENTWPSSGEGGGEIATDLLSTNYYIVMDGSGSMADRQCSGGKTKLHAATTALEAFAKRIPNDANIGLSIFDERGLSERVALGPNNKAKFSEAIFKARASQGTPLRSAITAGYNALRKQATNQLGYGEYHLVIVTDGQASGENQDPRGIVKDILTESPVIIHTIGFCIDNNHSLNQPGSTYYKAADNPEALLEGLDQVLAEAPNFNMDSFNSN